MLDLTRILQKQLLESMGGDPQETRAGETFGVGRKGRETSDAACIINSGGRSDES